MNRDGTDAKYFHCPRCDCELCYYQDAACFICGYKFKSEDEEDDAKIKEYTEQRAVEANSNEIH